MLDKIISVAKKFITISSIKENPRKSPDVLIIAKKELSGFTIEDFEKEGVPSLLIYKGKARPKRFKFILNAHLDVVPGKKEQFKPVVKDGKLYGRGAYDMKAAAAVEILVFKELAKKLNYPIALQLVTDEEIGGFNGTKYQLDKGVRSEFAIAGESTDLGIKNQAKGVVWAKIKTKGKTAHGAYPWMGKNAIWKMINALNHLHKSFPEAKKEIWKTTLNLSKIETSNSTFNKVPDDCTVGIDVRYIPDDAKTIVSKIKKALPKEAEVELLLKEPAQFTDKNNIYIKLLQKATKKVTNKLAPIIVKHGASDIRHFNRVGCDGIEFGPIGFGLHTDNEWVDIKSLEQYYLILKSFLSTI
ncbi:M20/M25/M40 family metallo-hydrolase [Candidatus Roizmanbacteria bacterium]|nr:M20/M25/M40 family metallo-hydrolase [Candidatus Roizmanbacteria bacterium]